MHSGSSVSNGTAIPGRSIRQVAALARASRDLDHAVRKTATAGWTHSLARQQRPSLAGEGQEVTTQTGFGLEQESC